MSSTATNKSVMEFMVFTEPLTAGVRVWLLTRVQLEWEPKGG